jgi:hypothetical protein
MHHSISPKFLKEIFFLWEMLVLNAFASFRKPLRHSYPTMRQKLYLLSENCILLAFALQEHQNSNRPTSCKNYPWKLGPSQNI